MLKFAIKLKQCVFFAVVLPQSLWPQSTSFSECWTNESCAMPEKNLLHAWYSPLDKKTYGYEIDDDDWNAVKGLSPLSEKAATTNLSSLVQDSVLAAHARYMKDQPLNSLSFSSIVFEKLDCRGADVWLCGVGIDGYCENRETIVPNLVTVFSLLNGKILSPVVTPFTQAVDSERQRLGALKIDWHIYGLLIICAWVVGCLTGMFVKKVYGKLVERSRSKVNSSVSSVSDLEC